MKVYLAAPFFNEAEVAMVEKLESHLRKVDGVKLFSPRLQSANAEGRDLRDPEVRAAIFKKNVKELRDAELVVAWLDRAFPADSKLVLQFADGGERDIHPQSDVGTVWEIGYARALGVPVIGFTESAKLNVMIAEGCDWIAQSISDVAGKIERYDRHGQDAFEDAPWEGEGE